MSECPAGGMSAAGSFAKLPGEPPTSGARYTSKRMNRYSRCVIHRTAIRPAATSGTGRLICVTWTPLVLLSASFAAAYTSISPQPQPGS